MNEDCLSPREREALALMRAGRSNREIAAAMGVGRSTVPVFLAKARRKLGVDAVPRRTRGRPVTVTKERWQDIRAMRAAGHTLKEIGQQFGVTLQRIHQILYSPAPASQKDAAA